ncbi:Gamma-tubulin complex component 2 [Micractinium conductrix]|uniref:Gamma-tubulin complex component n=1 Tax=Micractinium conductrix TaxID=554055 RepID=A0A2P6VQ20_9CHLO|nr:Gamma-tubulin complex component 2 [Micractinium conductrix]|eukprot:PSC76155.1 Gamma-tubulin complex component 2 [Micractinium conductrix]
MSGGGLAGAPGAGLPANLQRPEVLAALEVTRAKFAAQQAAAAAAAAQQPNGVAASASVPYRQQHQQPSQPQPSTGLPARPAGATALLGATRTNPMFGEAALFSPDKKSDREYTPVLADAIRAPTLDALAPDAGLPPVGDLFAATPQLPAYLPKGKDGAPALLGAPALPPWDGRRAFLTGRFVWDEAQERVQQGGAAAGRPAVLETYPLHVQEALLVDDLLSAFLGLSGTYVRAKQLEAPGGARLGYEVVAARGSLEPALQEMATRMLPICEYVAVIQRFVETRRAYAWGLVCQALAGAMRHVLQDWELMVAQLESQLRSGKLTLQALWYYVQPPLSALKLVASLAADASARRLRGAALLDALHSRCSACMGDAAAHRLALRLLRAAAEPYFSMLERWLCSGEVDDPYGEFMVQEDVEITRDSLNADNQSAFWHNRYTLRFAYDAMVPPAEPPPPATAAGAGSGGTTTAAPAVAAPSVSRPTPQLPHDVPAFLQRHKQHILDTGKYLNVMRQCKAEPPRTLPVGTRLEYDEGGKYALAIEGAHAAASVAAMELLRRQKDLAGGLGVLKRYFLTAQGDMVLHLMDAAEPEFARRVGSVPLQQLQSLLESAVRGSSAASDPAAASLAAAWDHRSILNMLVANQPALSALPGAHTPLTMLKPVTPAPMTASEKSTLGNKRTARECFMLSYEVPWPLSIAASEAALAQYQMVFRHIFELKWVERELSRVAALYGATTGVASWRACMRRRRDSVGSDGGAGGGGDVLAASLAVSYSACQLMTHFFRQYLLYVTFEVMEPLWAAFEAKLQTASSLDEIVEQHKAFLRRLMKGCLLSRKVVVLRSLLDLKEIALRFVRLSDEHASVKWDALDEEVEQRTLGAGRKPDGRREQRMLKATLARSALERQMSRPEFASTMRDLRARFIKRVREFMAALADAHRTAHSERTDSREELESLLNLMTRLDFNGFFSAQAPPREAGLAAAGSERMTVKFAA